MAIASHELKTPLTSLKLSLQMYERSISRQEPRAFTPEKMQSYLEKNSQSIDRLSRLVDDMLDISRIRTGKLTIKKEQCELSGIMQHVLARYRDQFDESGSGQPVIEKLETSVGEWDPLRIEQVMTNIITNALRYGRGKPIRISIINNENSFLITVKDNGLGIPKSDRDKIFERYERGLLAREVSGLGLGLYISKQIVEAHSGRIWVESEVGKGSSFFVELPAVAVSHRVSSEAEELIPV
jgi:signal transduction histidine kinase